MNRKMFIVTWGDAHQSLDQKILDEVRARHHPDPIHTQGYILIHDEIGISIAGELMPVTNGDAEESYRHLTFIPAGMILEIHEIKRSVKRKKKERTAVTEDVQATPVAAVISASDDKG